jgi:hypothetical protein
MFKIDIWLYFYQTYHILIITYTIFTTFNSQEFPENFFETRSNYFLQFNYRGRTIKSHSAVFCIFSYK